MVDKLFILTQFYKIFIWKKGMGEKMLQYFQLYYKKDCSNFILFLLDCYAIFFFIGLNDALIYMVLKKIEWLTM
jgi:hypothetical protein